MSDNFCWIRLNVLLDTVKQNFDRNTVDLRILDIVSRSRSPTNE